MTTDEFKRLQEAEKIIGEQHKLDKQIANLNRCGLVQIKGMDENGKAILFDIQAKSYITNNSVIEHQAREFIDYYVNYLECKKIELQERFDQL